MHIVVDSMTTSLLFNLEYKYEVSETRGFLTKTHPRLTNSLYSTISDITPNSIIMAEVQSQNFPQSPSTEGGEIRLNDNRSKEDQEADAKLAERLSVMIESANERVVPLVKMVRQVRCFRPLSRAH
jgi:hypothetical protein